MKVTTERLEDCQVNVFIEMDAADIDKKLRQTARKISRQFDVPGYRRGRAPFHAVIRVFGREAVQQETLEEFGQELYNQAMEEIEYEAFQPGDLQEVEWDPFRMTVLLPIVPEVDIGDYRVVRVPFEPEPVTEEQIEEYLAKTQQDHAQWVPAERPAVLGDQVIIDAEGKIDEDTVLSNEDYEMLLEADASYPLPGFHEEIVGMSVGEDKAFELTYPDDDFEEEVAGKEATFTVHLHSVKEEDVPVLDDELAMMVGDYDTIDDLRASVRETLEAEALQEAESQYLDGVLEAIIETAVKIEYPPQAIDREADVALDQMERNLASSGLQLDTYLNMLGKTRDAYRSELHPAAEERLKKRLVMVEVSKQEKLELEDEEIEAQINRVSESMGENADQMREFLETPQGRLSVADDLMSTKVQERIVEIGKGEAPPLEAEDETEPEAETNAADETPAEEAGAEAESDVADETPVEEPESEATEETAGQESEAVEAQSSEPEAPTDDAAESETDAADETPAEEAGAEAESDAAVETPAEEAGAEAESDAAVETPVEEPESEATEETAGQESEAVEAQSSEPEAPTDDAAESDEETIEEAESNDSD